MIESSPVVKRAAIFFTGDSNIDPDGVAKKKKKKKNRFAIGLRAPLCPQRDTATWGRHSTPKRRSLVYLLQPNPSMPRLSHSPSSQSSPPA